jgi:hypothetical protein
MPEIMTIKPKLHFIVQMTANLYQKRFEKERCRSQKVNSKGSADDYNHFRSSIKSEIKIAYSHYLQHVSTSLKRNPKSVWSFVKSKRDSNAIPPEMRCGNKNLSNPDEIADHFAKTFINNNNSSRAYNQDGLNFSLNANILRVVFNRLPKLPNVFIQKNTFVSQKY